MIIHSIILNLYFITTTFLILLLLSNLLYGKKVKLKEALTLLAWPIAIFSKQGRKKLNKILFKKGL